jgi:hypothetical protein
MHTAGKTLNAQQQQKLISIPKLQQVMPHDHARVSMYAGLDSTRTCLFLTTTTTVCPKRAVQMIHDAVVHMDP